MREQDVQRKIIKYLEDLPDSWVVKTISTNKRGTPDILACVSGRFVAIEVKAEGKLATVSKLQQYQIDRINSSGGLAIAVDNLDDVKKFLLTL